MYFFGTETHNTAMPLLSMDLLDSLQLIIQLYSLASIFFPAEFVQMRQDFLYKAESTIF